MLSKSETKTLNKAAVLLYTLGQAPWELQEDATAAAEALARLMNHLAGLDQLATMSQELARLAEMPPESLEDEEV